MEMEFMTSEYPCLKPALWDTCIREETQEIRLSDGMPDVGSVVSAWGQCILRSKEWNLDHISCSAGMMVWVLYAPEDGSQERVIHTWIPFQLRWDLPEDTPEGMIRILCLPKQTDARSLSPRKILVRAGMSALAQAVVPENITVRTPARENPEVFLLTRKYPVRLMKESGETTFTLEEALSLPDAAPKMESLVYSSLDPQIQDSKVLSDKLVFRGNAKLHMLYRSQEGQLHGWDFSIPFSQYASLDRTHGPDAQADLMFGVTSLEPEYEDGQLRLKCGLVCQYLVTDQEMLELTADSYSNHRELELERSQIVLQGELERKHELLRPEQTLPVDANVAVDVRFLPDFPRQRKTENGVTLLWPGNFQVLYYGSDGTLRGSTVRWEGEKPLLADDAVTLCALPEAASAQGIPGSGAMTLNGELPVSWTATTRQEIPMVSGIRLGEPRKPDSCRPSLILRRAGAQSLWEMAKKNGSTVEAIRNANDLTDQPEEDQMLLIPVV